jgi:hypothetical protein
VGSQFYFIRYVVIWQGCFLPDAFCIFVRVEQCPSRVDAVVKAKIKQQIRLYGAVRWFVLRLGNTQKNKKYILLCILGTKFVKMYLERSD